MSHLHIPDGILPVWLWLGGLAVAMAAVLFSLYMVRGMDLRKKIPLLGMMSAMMIVGMNLEIVSIAYHVNLSVITGIILGPWLAVIASLIVNLLLALVGHGGITVIGLNTAVIASESVVGYALYKMLKRAVKPGAAAWLSTAASLFLSTCLMLLIVFIANVDFSRAGASELRELMEKPTTATLSGLIHINNDFNFRFFAYAALGLGSIGWLIEASVTAVAVKFIAKVKPELLS